MKKRLGTVLLLALFVISSMMPTSAATAEIWNEARASHYFDAYMLGISAKGGGEMAVSFGVLEYIVCGLKAKSPPTNG